MITSTSSSQVKHIVNLQKKSKLRKEEKQFVVEGIKMVSEAPKDRLVKVYVSETFKADNDEFLKKMNYEALGKDILEAVSDNVFIRMSDTQTPQGIMAVVKMSEITIEDLFGRDMHINSNTIQPLLLILENLQDPGNLGTIIRMAEGAGVTGVIMSCNTVDIYNPKTIRSTMGSLYRVPVIYVDDICEAVEECKQKGIRVYAAHLKGTDNYNLCLTASYVNIVHAIAAFSDSTFPCIGILTSSSALSVSLSVSPFPSLPIINAVGCV